MKKDSSGFNIAAVVGEEAVVVLGELFVKSSSIVVLIGEGLITLLVGCEVGDGVVVAYALSTPVLASFIMMFCWCWLTLGVVVVVVGIAVGASDLVVLVVMGGLIVK